MYLKDNDNKAYGNFKSLEHDLKQKGKTLLFAMNGGMYQKDQSPQGLYIENGKILKQVYTVQKAYGNFYMQPNGIFYITKDKVPYVIQTSDFKHSSDIEYATQSGPMLLIEGKIHSKFNKGSSYLNIRNGVGILPNNNLLFAMSKTEINFYDFATFFKTKGCKNALYLDGFVSRTYLPTKNWTQTDGNFGVLIGVTN